MPLAKIIRAVTHIGAVVSISQSPTAALAFECPQHFSDTQAAINKIMGDMEGLKTRISEANKVAMTRNERAGEGVVRIFRNIVDKYQPRRLRIIGNRVPFCESRKWSYPSNVG